MAGKIRNGVFQSRIPDNGVPKPLEKQGEDGWWCVHFVSFSRPVMMCSTQPIESLVYILCTLLEIKCQSRTMWRSTGCTLTRSATEKNTTGPRDPIICDFLQGSRIDSIYTLIISTSKWTMISWLLFLWRSNEAIPTQNYLYLNGALK